MDKELVAKDLLIYDIDALSKGLQNKDLKDIDFDKVIEYLELLKNEVERVKSGIYAMDNSIHYVNGDISFAREKEL